MKKLRDPDDAFILWRQIVPPSRFKEKTCLTEVRTNKEVLKFHYVERYYSKYSIMNQEKKLRRLNVLFFNGGLVNQIPQSKNLLI